MMERTGTASTPKDGVTVGAASTLAMAANPKRTGATFVNDSDEVIYLALGPVAAMNEGIPLWSRGSYEINASNLHTGEVYAICSSGGKNLCITEK